MCFYCAVIQSQQERLEWFRLVLELSAIQIKFSVYSYSDLIQNL